MDARKSYLKPEANLLVIRLDQIFLASRSYNKHGNETLYIPEEEEEVDF
jgi:hypothetical protein